MIDLKERLKRWLSCINCTLHHYRRKVVLGRGEVPAELLFIGEAPGRSEDLIGEAFVGRAGRILSFGIEDAIKLTRRKPTYYITNIVGCIPLDERRGPLREPARSEWVSCWPRLELTHRLVDPEKVVFLGSIARIACAERFPGAIALQHPAYIARRGGVSSMEYRTFVRELSDIFTRTPPSRLGTRDVFGDVVRRQR